MSDRLHQDDLIFVGAAILLSSRAVLQVGLELNPAEIRAAVESAHALYREVGEVRKRATVAGVLGVTEDGKRQMKG